MNKQQIIDHRIRTSKSIKSKRIDQLRFSILHYFNEIRNLNNINDIFEWVYYKFPTYFFLRNYPSAITIEITNDCNFSCPHCPRTILNIGRGIGFMPLDVFEKIAREAAGHVKRMKFVGMGESALHPDLGAMMDILRRHRIEAVVYTNGTLFEQYTPEQICAWGPSVIVLSIDGTNAREFKRLRVGGDFETTRRNLSDFRKFRDQQRKRSPIIEIRHVIMPGETPAMLRQFRMDWLDGLGDTVKFNLLGPRYDAPRQADPSRPSCRDIRREIHPRFDGRVPLCGYDGQQEWIGDLKTSTLSEVWNAPRLKAVRRDHRRRDLSELPFCKTCQFR